MLFTSCTSRGETVSGTLAVIGYDAVILEGLTAYVKGIDNLYEFDKGPESGWIYFINGERATQSAGVYKPAEGDSIVWQYIIE
jgi:hypothetical protein